MGEYRRVWFALPIVLFLGLGALAVHFFLALRDDVVDMKRVVVPGEAEVELGAGEYVLYAETTSEVDGRGYHAEGVSFSCSVTDPDGAPVSLETPSTSSSYTMFGFAGKSAFELDAPLAGTYRIDCRGDGGPAVLAIGRGFGTSLLFCILCGIGAFVLPGVALALILSWRWKARRTVAVAA